MNTTESSIEQVYGEKLRVRVCGICIKDNQILLVKHRSLGQTGTLYAPPGGGMEYGESAKEALEREFLEETHLEITVKDFLFVHEYLDPPLHGIELFFLVEPVGGKLMLGNDPEMDKDSQLITEVGYFSLAELRSNNLKSLHYVLQNINDLNTLINQKGYFKFHE